MSEDQSPRSDPRLVFAATVPLKVPPRFTAMELLATVSEMLEGTGVSASLVTEMSDLADEAEGGSRFWGRPQSPPRAGLTINGITMMVVGHDRPAFSGDEMKRLDFAAWSSGAERIARTRAHVEINEVETSLSKDLDYNYDRAAALTVAAAAVNRLSSAAAVIWHTSRRAIPAEKIGPIFEALMGGDAPVGLWISNPPLPSGAGGAATRGFYALLGAEIAVISNGMTPDEAGVVAGELASDILRSGEAPGHGERLHYERGTQFLVEHRAIGVDGGLPVVILAQVAEPSDVMNGAKAPADASDSSFVPHAAGSSEPEPESGDDPAREEVGGDADTDGDGSDKPETTSSGPASSAAAGAA